MLSKGQNTIQCVVIHTLDNKTSTSGMSMSGERRKGRTTKAFQTLSVMFCYLSKNSGKQSKKLRFVPQVQEWSSHFSNFMIIHNQKEASNTILRK